MKRLRPGQEAWMLLYLPLYLLLFHLAEQYCAPHYWITDGPLDFAIPFVPGFVFAYVSWYPLMIGMTFYLLFRDRRAFVEYGWMVILGFTASLATFFVLPSAQNLRPALMGSGLAQRLLRGIYMVDTNTNVFPSMHVVGTLAAVCAAYRTPALRPAARRGIVLLGLMINVSTLLVKQHALLDVLGGIAYFAVMYLLVCALPEWRKLRAVRSARRRHAAQL